MSNWHPIIEDKIEQLIYLIDKINLEYPEKSRLSENDFTTYLQDTCSEIHIALAGVFNYIKENNLDPPVFEILKRKCKILIEKANLFERKLIDRGSSFDDFYIDVDYLLADKNIPNLNKSQHTELIEYINLVTSSFKLNQFKPQYKIHQKQTKSSKHSQRWYALLYWIELKATDENPPINRDGGFIRSKIQEIGAAKTNSKGQSFYRSFIEIDLETEILKKSFGVSWKNVVIDLSKNNPLVITYLEENFN